MRKILAVLAAIVILVGLLLPVHSVAAQTTPSVTWSTKASMLAPRRHASSVTIGSKIYVVAGETGHCGFTTRNEVYDASTNTWSTLAPMSLARSRFAAVTYGNKIYAIAGAISCWDPPTDSLEIYDIATDTWAAGDPLAQRRYEHGAAVVGGKIYVMGGNMADGSGCIDTMEVYDIASGNWSAGTSLPSPDCGKAAAIGNEIYFLGGLGNLSKYSILTGSWSPRASLEDSRGVDGSSLEVYEGKLYVISPPHYDYPGNTPLDDVEIDIYDPATNSWTRVEHSAPWVTPRFAFATGIVGNSLFIMGGDDDGAAPSNVYDINEMGTIQTAPCTLYDDFNDGDFTNNPAWYAYYSQGCAPHVGTVEVNNGELHVRQWGAGGCGQGTGIHMDLDIPIANQKATITFDVKAVYASLSGSGSGPWEYPAMLKITVQDANGEEKQLLIGYNYWGTPNVQGPTPGAEYVYVVGRCDAPQDTWLRGESFVIQDYWPTASKITSIYVMGGGHDYESRFDNICLRLEPAAVTDPGYVLIVAGDSPWWKEWSYKWGTNLASNNIYRAFRNLGYSDDRIIYLNNDHQYLNGQQVVDGNASDLDVMNALGLIDTLVETDNLPVSIFLLGEGNKEVFLLNENNGGGSDVVLSSSLDYQLQHNFEANLKLIAIVCCYSGSFITDCNEPGWDSIYDSVSGNNRIVISGSNDDEIIFVPWLVRFTYDFSRSLMQGDNVRDAFLSGARYRDGAMIDDTGDAKGHHGYDLGDDGMLAAGTIIGKPGSDNLELDPWIYGSLGSPGELRVYDSQDRVTGLVNGVVRQEIPNSAYYPDEESFLISPSSDIYRYEAVGVDEGTYNLEITSLTQEGAVTFSAIGITTTSGTQHQYEIDWSALSQGQKGVTLRIDANGDGTFEQTITSDTTLEPPVAEAGGPYAGDEGSQIAFSASGSEDPDGTIAQYNWDLGDGSTILVNSTPTHAYGDNGVYTVTLTVTDDDGLTSTDTAEVRVNNTAPMVDTIIVPTDPVAVNTPVNAWGNFTDPGWLDTHTAAWDWGDGSASAGAVTESNGSGNVTGSHTYNCPGVYTITLSVIDDDGDVGTATATVTVTPQAMKAFVIKNLAIMWAPHKPGWQGRDLFSIFGRLQLPQGYTWASLEKEAMLRISIADKSGNDTVVFEGKLGGRPQSALWVYRGSEQPPGEGMNITTMAMWWAPQGTKWAGWGGFYIGGVLQLPEPIGINTTPANVKVTLEIPLTTATGCGSLVGEQAVPCKVYKPLNLWTYNAWPNLPTFPYEPTGKE